MSIIAELKRRKVFQVAAVYAVVTWLAVQIITAIEEPLALPGWTDTFVIVLLAIGFPIALILSWAFDVTPDGIKVTNKVDRDSTSVQAPANTVTYVMQGLVLLAVGFLLVDQYLLDGAQQDTQAANPRDDSGPVVTRFELAYNTDDDFTARRPQLAISPDGRFFVYIVSGELFLRTMSELEPRQIVSVNGASTLTISPNGQALAYWSSATEQLSRVAISGGAPAPIANGIKEPYGISWASDGTILYADRGGIFRVPEDGSMPPQLIIATSNDLQAYGPQLLPDGNSVLFSVAYPGDWDGGEIVVESISSHERKVLLTGGTAARYLSSGHLVYALDEQLFAIEFNLNSMKVVGEAFPVADEVVRASNVWETGAAHYDVSRNGTLVYMTANVDRALELTWVDRLGGETAIPLEPGDYSSPRISPQEDHALLDVRGPGNPIVTWDFANQTITRLRLGPNGGDTPIWTPDGEHIAYHPGTRPLIDQRSINNVGVPTRIVTGGIDALDPYHPEAYSPSGDSIIINGPSSLTTGWDIGMIDLEGNGEPQWLLRGPAMERSAALTLDGRWLAYQSDESGRNEVYVRPFPNVEDDRWQVSNRGGTDPRWSKDGNELYYLERGDTARLIAVDVDTSGTEFSFGDRNPLFDWIYSLKFHKSYDVSADGQRFLALKSATNEQTTPKIIIVQNWLEELREATSME